MACLVRVRCLMPLTAYILQEPMETNGLCGKLQPLLLLGKVGAVGCCTFCTHALPELPYLFAAPSVTMRFTLSSKAGPSVGTEVGAGCDVTRQKAGDSEQDVRLCVGWGWEGGEWLRLGCHCWGSTTYAHCGCCTSWCEMRHTSQELSKDEGFLRGPMRLHRLHGARHIHVQ